MGTRKLLAPASISRDGWLVMQSIAVGVVVGVFFCVSCGDKQAAPTSPPPSEESVAEPAPERQDSDPSTGHGLLDAYVETFRTMAAAAGGVNTFVEELNRLSARATAKRSQGLLNEEFARRYQRLVKLTKRVLEPTNGESRAQLEKELESFVADVEGKPRAIDPLGGLADVAPAFAEEMLNLRMLLDGSSDREKARQKYFPRP